MKGVDNILKNPRYAHLVEANVGKTRIPGKVASPQRVAADKHAALEKLTARPKRTKRQVEVAFGAPLGEFCISFMRGERKGLHAQQ